MKCLILIFSITFSLHAVDEQNHIELDEVVMNITEEGEEEYIGFLLRGGFIVTRHGICEKVSIDEHGNTLRSEVESWYREILIKFYLTQVILEE